MDVGCSSVLWMTVLNTRTRGDGGALCLYRARTNKRCGFAKPCQDQRAQRHVLRRQCCQGVREDEFGPRECIGYPLRYGSEKMLQCSIARRHKTALVSSGEQNSSTRNMFSLSKVRMGRLWWGVKTAAKGSHRMESGQSMVVTSLLPSESGGSPSPDIYLPSISTAGYIIYGVYIYICRA